MDLMGSYHIILMFVILAYRQILAQMPPPFTRKLYLTTPPLQGKDVVILQNLLPRSSNVTVMVNTTGVYDRQTALAVNEYKKANSIKSDPLVFDSVSASLMLDQLSYDDYKDDGQKPFGYKFKIIIPVHKDRNIETNGTLLNPNNEVVFKFRVRAHGSLDSSGKAVNQLTRNGNTPTGLIKCDLNSKEPSKKSFGPYPVVRAVKGLKGNAAIGKNEDDTFLSDYRSGILIHTGEWKHWNPTMNMPNSAHIHYLLMALYKSNNNHFTTVHYIDMNRPSNGCLHVHPEDMKKMDTILTDDLDVVVNENPFGEQPYPYQCQGLLSIQQIDDKMTF